MDKQINDSFLISLNGISLTNMQKQKINSGIQEVVMRELANIDIEIVVKKKRVEIATSIKDLPFIWGIWIENLKDRIIVSNQQQR